MIPYEEKKIIQWGRGLDNDVTLILNLTEDERSADLQIFCNELAGLASRVKISEVRHQNGRIPSIDISKNLRYSAVPSGLQLELFLQALNYHKDGLAFLPAVIKEKVAEIDSQVLLTLYVSQQCPHCPASVRQLTHLASINTMISLHIIDGTMFWEQSKADAVECIPTTLFGSDFRWSGVTALDDIVEVISNRDPSDFSAATIERMLDERNALKVADMMLNTGKIHPALFDFMIDERFFLRLGAMTALEEITKRNPVMATQMARPLGDRLTGAIEPMQIDILYLIGDAGTSDAIPLLESVLNGEYRDHVKETAREAIDCIKKRHALN